MNNTLGFLWNTILICIWVNLSIETVDYVKRIFHEVQTKWVFCDRGYTVTKDDLAKFTSKDIGFLMLLDEYFKAHKVADDLCVEMVFHTLPSELTKRGDVEWTRRLKN